MQLSANEVLAYIAVGFTLIWLWMIANRLGTIIELLQQGAMK